MNKVVIDTNVFVSFFFGRNPQKIIDLWKSSDIHLCLSPAIIEEYMEVIKRLRLRDEDELGELMNIFAENFNISVIGKSGEQIPSVANSSAPSYIIRCDWGINPLRRTQGNSYYFKKDIPDDYDR